jgi:hypothetical protein
VAFAPGALRSAFGDASPFDTAEDERLAQVVLRPGRLLLTPWSAEAHWPIDTADLALRRAGWDIDPGWLPWIGRVVRFRYGGGSGA